MDSRRRLSEAISEGEAISLLVQVNGVAAAASAEAAGAEGIWTLGVVAGLSRSTALPTLVTGTTPEEAQVAGADAWLLVTESAADALDAHELRARDLGLECVVDVRDEEELEAVLARIDPEIVLLSSRGAERAEEEVDRVLELLPDVPAGKLVVAELHAPTPEDLQALERAGVDAVLVVSGDLAAS